MRAVLQPTRVVSRVCVECPWTKLWTCGHMGMADGARHAGIVLEETLLVGQSQSTTGMLLAMVP